jgi:hypothetical protein
MRNIINSQQQHAKVFTGLLNLNVDLIIDSGTYTPVFFITANGQLAYGFANRKAISYPLQNPIKNIIGYPE